MNYKLLASAVFLFGVVTAVHATPISLVSDATTVQYVPGSSAVNTGSTATYDISAGSVWHSALGSSSYVSFNAGTGTPLTYVAPNGVYVYTTSFFAPTTTSGPYSGTLTVLADDTLSVWLNGVEILAPGPPLGPGNTYSHCSDSGPNCVTPFTFSFGGIQAGMTNVLQFDVLQVMGAYTGLDYVGTIDAVPEPSSLILLGTGLVGFAGSMLKLFKR